MRSAWKTVLLVAAPIVLGLLMDRLIMMGMPPFLFSLAFVVFWAWVGTRFAIMEIKGIYSFLLGNSLNILFGFLFIWSYVIKNRGFGIGSTLVQLYILPVVSFSSRIHSLFSSGLYSDSRVAIIISFLLLIQVFSVGYFYKVFRTSAA